jgi:hypothetical protein
LQVQNLGISTLRGGGVFTGFEVTVPLEYLLQRQSGGGFGSRRHREGGGDLSEAAALRGAPGRGGCAEGDMGRHQTFFLWAGSQPVRSQSNSEKMCDS